MLLNPLNLIKKIWYYFFPFESDNWEDYIDWKKIPNEKRPPHLRDKK